MMPLLILLGRWYILPILYPDSLRWRHNEGDGVSNHQPRDYLLNRLFRRRSKKTSKLRVTGLCVGNSPLTGEIPAQRANNAEDVSIWWRHHVSCLSKCALSPLLYCRADSTFAPSQWEPALLCDDASHWLGANMESALYCNLYFWPRVKNMLCLGHQLGTFVRLI